MFRRSINHPALKASFVSLPLMKNKQKIQTFLVATETFIFLLKTAKVYFSVIGK